MFDIKIPSKWYRRIIGGLEVSSGFSMALIPNCECHLLSYHAYIIRSVLLTKCSPFIADKIKNTANVILLSLMLLAIYSHYMVSDPFERCGPALVFTFMLTGRLVVWYQVSDDEQNCCVYIFKKMCCFKYFVSPSTDKPKRGEKCGCGSSASQWLETGLNAL